METMNKLNSEEKRISASNHLDNNSNNKINKNSNNKQNNNNNKLKHLFNKFEPITLSEMNNVALLNRAETKYIMNIDTLMKVLEELPKYYKILEIENLRQNHYQTLYYDTKNFDMYKKHHNGGLNRFKVRTREYLDSDLSFVEVKYKTNKDKTIKKRIQTTQNPDKLQKTETRFIDKTSEFNSEDLVPTLWNKYTRVTLVSKSSIERLTLDFNLEFKDQTKEKEAALTNLVIAEVKQEGFSQKSDFIKLMHKYLVRSTGFSKYCVGVSMLYQNLKHNNFKEKLLLAQKITGEVY